MQIALVAVVLLAGMWFTVLKPKPDDGSSSAPIAAAPAAAPAAPKASSEPVAPGVKGLTSAIDKAKAASKTSDAANAKIESATGSPSAATKTAAVKAKTPAVKAKAAPTAAARKSGTKAATQKAAAARPATPAKTATPVDPSDRLLAYLGKGKTLVVLFYGKSADDASARKAVHRTALADPKHVVSAYVPIAEVGHYSAITSGVDIVTFPTILVIGTDRKATALTGYADAGTVEQAVGDARRNAAAAAKAK
jgi:hypothetical protein